MAANLQQLVAGAPKAELHMHIEGSLEPELMFELAAKNAVSIPYPTVDAVRAAYQFSDLQSFLDIYYAGAAVLLHEEDFYAMTRAYLERAHADNVVHTEIFFDPQTHTARGVPFQVVVEGITRALAEAQRRYGMGYRLILCFLRHLSEADAFATLEQAVPHLGLIHGVGLDSSERGHPPSKFERVFARARELGLRVVAHAGEEGPPAYIYEALDLLKVERIDHGVRALEDAALVARLAASRMPLTVCPLSNVKLCVFPRLAEHNLRRLLAAGLCATVNSDDPAYFGGYINENFRQTAAALDLTRDELYRLLKNGFEAAFLTDAERAQHYAALDGYWQSL
ncbi:MAG: adenosine deaminase [Rhodocyclaceae bacterium]|nr:adenosine deaminase [Rhodocyclaceae bacterium]MBX3667074.1 adenosine deaminase [Rhodocyclaceae bacterium]